MRVAIIDDNGLEAQTLAAYLTEFYKNAGLSVQTKIYSDIILFAEDYRNAYELVFLCVHKLSDGIKNELNLLRKYDDAVPLVLVSELPEIAILGYGVNALDFILSPIKQKNFVTTMIRITDKLHTRAPQVVLKTADGIRKVALNTIYFVEVRDHRLTYHTMDGEISVWGTLSEQEKNLPSNFAKCSKCYIVNLCHVTHVGRDSVRITKTQGGGGSHCRVITKKLLWINLTVFITYKRERRVGRSLFHTVII